MEITQVSTTLSPADKLESIKVRLGFGRMDHTVEPGLYSVGDPDQESPVLVSANYKLSFDALRKELININAYIMVIDTKGINVWCAAGKGTFGTEEIVNRISTTNLAEVVNHRKIILPQLGAPGVAAHEVQKQTGFKVIYGPVRASDIPIFLDNGLEVTAEMRQVKFTIIDRLELIPLEIIISGKYLMAISFVAILLSLVAGKGQTVNTIINLLLAYLAGTALGPLLLPWLPGRSFSVKGLFCSLIVISLGFSFNLFGTSWLEILAWPLIISSISSFLLMNFTGSSTYTSLSGVQKEMKVAIPIQSVALGLGVILWLSGIFII